MSKRIIHYKRVSTEGQKTDSQNESIVMGARVYEEKCSGTIPFKDRPMSKATIIDEIEGGDVGEFHVYSIDRLGRNTLDIMQTIQWMTDNKVCVVSSKEGIKTLDDDGKENMMSKMIIGVLGTLAEFDYNMRRTRQKDGIREAQKRGVYVGGTGRKKGQTESDSEFLTKPKNKYILKLLKKGIGIRDTVLKTKDKFGRCSSATVVRVKDTAIEKGLLKAKKK